MARTTFSGRAFDELNYMWWTVYMKKRVPNGKDEIWLMQILAQSDDHARYEAARWVAAHVEISVIVATGTIEQYEATFQTRVENPEEETPILAKAPKV